jgi:hypothetical protein
VVRGHDLWANDQPEIDTGKAARTAAEHANSVYHRMERAKGEVVAALADPNLPATSRDRLQQLCAQVGVLQYPQEVR